MKIKMTALAIAMAVGMTSGGVMAQEQQQSSTQAQMQQQAKNADFSDSELEKFVNVQEKLGEVRSEYQSKMESASEEEAQGLQQEAQQEMMSHLEKSDMGVEKYNKIAMAYSSNEEVRERVDEMMQE